MAQRTAPFRRPISLKVYSIALGLLALMVLVSALSAHNLKSLNNEVAALAKYYLPLDQQVSSVDTLIRQQNVHFERILLLQQLSPGDKAAIARESDLFDQRGINADQVIDSSILLVTEALGSTETRVDQVTLALLRDMLPNIQSSRQEFHAVFRNFLTEAQEGNPRSLKVVRDALARERDRINAHMEKAIVTLQGVIEASAKRAATEEAGAVRLNWIITAIAAVLGLFFAAIVTRLLVEPVRRLLRGTKAVEEGDLDVRVEASSADEIATLTESFNSMVAGLRIVSGLLDDRLASAVGEKKHMSVFFSDIVGFTGLGEQLAPEGVVRFLNRYFSVMSGPIHDQHGIVDKFIGDAIMAYWGPPFTGEDEHAVLACYAALDQIARLGQFQAMLPDILGLRRGLPEIGIRIGIATGDVTIGNIGSESIKGFTVIGDTVNLASRLEGVNKAYGTRILISEETRRLAADAIEARAIDSIRVMGKSEPVGIYELLGRGGQLDAATRELRTHFEKALENYRAGSLEAAEQLFRQCLSLRADDGPSRVWLERILHERDHPGTRSPDGVWNMTTK
jgi:adenylate cyclase